MKIVLCVQQDDGRFISGNHHDCRVQKYTTVALAEATARFMALKRLRIVRCQAYADHDTYCDQQPRHTSYCTPAGRTLPCI
jgi:hypothetical protein